jgi:hypothetical protein
MSGFSYLDQVPGIEVVEEPFEGGEEERFEWILENCPDALPIKEINPLAKIAVPIGRQVTVGSSSLDLLFLDDTGSLLVIECKLVQNPEARREVIAQLMEYAQAIENDWDLERVKTVSEEYLRGKGIESGLTAYLNRALQEAHFDSVTERAFFQRVRSKMKHPYLVVAGNGLDQRALVLTDFLRKLKVPIVCTEFRRYKAGERRFVIGFVKSATLFTATSSSQRVAITEEEWRSLIDVEPLKSARIEFLEWAKELSSKGLVSIRIGSKELMLDKAAQGMKRNILSISDRIFFFFGNLRILGCVESAIEAFRHGIDNLLGAGVLSSRNEWPSIRLDALDSEEKRRKVMELFVELLASLKS